MKIIDCHINISSNESWFNTKYDASYDNIIRKLNNSGICKGVLVAMPGACSNEFFYKDLIDREKFWIFGNIDFDHIEKSFSQITELKLDGIKIHPRFQKISIMELDQLDIFSRINDLCLPLMICGWQQSSTIYIEDVCPLKIDIFAKKYQNIKFIISHLGGHKFWDAFTVARSNENVFLDCSYFLKFFKNTSLESDFFNILSSIDRKILYGSDFPEVSIKIYKEYFIQKTKSINSTKLDNILFNNINNLISI